MKNKILCFGLVLIFLALMCGCNAEKACVLENSDIADCSSSVSNTETSEETDTTVESEPKKATETAITASETNEPEAAPTESKNPVETEKTDIPAAPTAEPPNQTTTQAEPEKQPEQPKEQTTAEQKPVEKPTEKPAEPKPTEPPKQTFDVSPYVSYAKEYAVSIGLSLDSTATECWDNPISANPNRSGIKSDIESRLNRYKNSEGFTAVWVWAEKVSDTEYEIYIGYC
jgi:FtsZ-interacting cell division protein ZipA